MVDELPEGHVGVVELALGRVERLAPLDRQRGVDGPDAEVVRALGRAAAEHGAHLVEDVAFPRRALAVVEAVAGVGAGEDRTRRDDVQVEEPLEAQRGHLRALLGAEALVGALRAHRVEPSAPVRGLAAPERSVGVLLHHELGVEGVGDHVAVAERRVPRDLVAEVLDVPDAGLEPLLAAERRLDREDLRVAPVVSAHVPAHEAELRAVHADFRR